MKLSKSEAGRLGNQALVRNNAIRKEIAIKSYNENPKLCTECNGPIEYKTRRIKMFCNHSCAAKYHNRLKPRKSKVVRVTRQDLHLARFISGEIDNRPTLKRLLIKQRGYSCETCHNDKWQNQPIPLEVDHINGDASNNRPDNLRLLCPNCHALTPTAKGKNRGNGRKSRGLPTH
jgi:5-methylcytosine-specific restriction endonuclease McrA